MGEHVMAVTGIWHSSGDLEVHSNPADNTDIFVGAYPYLDTIDTDTSYIESVTRTSNGGGYTGYTVPAWNAPGPVIGARLEMQGKQGSAYNQRVHFQWDGPTSFYYNQDFMTRRPRNTWELLTDQLDPINDTYGNLARLGDNLATGRVEVKGSYDGYPYFLSALRLVIITAAGGIPPLRQRHRDDGLTTDARQQRGNGSSLQSSLRRGGRVYY